MDFPTRTLLRAVCSGKFRVTVEVKEGNSRLIAVPRIQQALQGSYTTAFTVGELDIEVEGSWEYTPGFNGVESDQGGRSGGGSYPYIRV